MLKPKEVNHAVSASSLMHSAESAYGYGVPVPNYDEAEKLFLRSITMYENDLGQDSWWLIRPLYKLAQMYSLQQWGVAESERPIVRQKMTNNYDKLIDVIKVNHNNTFYPMSSTQYLLILEDVVYDYYFHLGKEHEVENYLMELLDYYDSNYGKDSIHSVPILFGLADLYGYNNLDDKTKQVYERVAHIYDVNHSNTSLQWVEMLRTMSIHFELSKRVLKSEEILVRAVEILEENHIDAAELNGIKKRLEVIRTKVECTKYGWAYGPECKGMNSTTITLY